MVILVNDRLDVMSLTSIRSVSNPQIPKAKLDTSSSTYNFTWVLRWSSQPVITCSEGVPSETKAQVNESTLVTSPMMLTISKQAVWRTR